MMETELDKLKVLRLSNEESHKLTKECIQKALIFLMDTTPFEQITITAIIKRSGVSRGAFYRNYSSKEDVMEEITAELTSAISAKFAQILDGQKPHEWLTEALINVKDNREACILIKKANLPLYKIMDQGVEGSGIAIKSQKDRYALHALYAVLWSITLEWLDRGATEPPEEIANIMISVINIKAFQ